MALFESDDKPLITSKKIRPTIIRTQNIVKEIAKIAKMYEIHAEHLDFNILEVQTYTRTNYDGKEAEWEELAPEELYELDDQNALLNPNFQIKQIYEVEIFSRDLKDPKYASYEHFNLAIGANATKCKIYLSIKAGSNVKYVPSFEADLLTSINKLKIRAGILINIFDEMLSDVVSKITAHVRVQEEVHYEKNETHLIAQSFEPTSTINDAVILHFDEKKEINDNERVDYAQRGFIHSIYKDDLIIEYIKPKEGKPGRNCRGEFLKPKDPETKYEPNFGVDDTIKVVDSPKNIAYYAKVNGYVAFEDGKYIIKSEVDIPKIDFKTTGSIAAGLDADVSISVKEKDSVKDAIGPGMTVEVTEIHVDGNVGSHAVLNAITASVDGQTHKTSQIRAQNLKINIHKGTAYGKHININRLEHGDVDGDVVEIEQALGGHVRAKEVTLILCGSYVKATASRLIEIKKLQGSENVFTIDPLLKRDMKEGFGANQKDIAELEKVIKELQKEIEEYIQLVQVNTAAFNDVKKRLVGYKNKGVKMPESFVKKYKQFNGMQEHLTAIKKEYAVKVDQLNLLTTRTASFQDSIFNARIINRGEWVGHNELVFKLVDPPVEVSYKPKEGSKEKIFGLVAIADGEYEIQAVE